jgi:hypothetical protein
MTRTFVMVWALAPVFFAPLANAACDGAPTPAPASPAAGYPSLCNIPKAPKDVPTAATFKERVVATRVAGAVLARDGAPESFTLDDMDAFVAAARGAGAAPPPVDAAALDTEAFVKAMRARASGSPKP